MRRTLAICKASGNLPNPRLLSHQHRSVKWSIQSHASRVEKADIRNYFWLGFTYPGLDCDCSVVACSMAVWAAFAKRCKTSRALAARRMCGPLATEGASEKLGHLANQLPAHPFHMEPDKTKGPSGRPFPFKGLCPCQVPCQLVGGYWSCAQRISR